MKWGDFFSRLKDEGITIPLIRIQLTNGKVTRIGTALEVDSLPDVEDSPLVDALEQDRIRDRGGEW